MGDTMRILEAMACKDLWTTWKPLCVVFFHKLWGKRERKQ